MSLESPSTDKIYYSLDKVTAVLQKHSIKQEYAVSAKQSKKRENISKIFKKVFACTHENELKNCKNQHCDHINIHCIDCEFQCYILNAKSKKE